MKNNETIHERITQLVNVFGKGKNTIFASIIGSNEANVRGYKTSVMPKFDFLEKIARNIDVDLKWLLTGEGSMLLEDGVQQPGEPVSASSDAVTMRLMDKLDQKESKIDQLQSELRAMEKELTAKMLKMAEEIGNLKAQLSQYEPKAEGSNEKVKGLGHARTVSTGKPSSLNADNATSAAAQ